MLDTFEEDTLVEAIARELERSHGFTYIGDEKLRASMSVGVEDEDTYLVEQSDEFRSIVAELERPSGPSRIYVYTLEGRHSARDVEQDLKHVAVAHLVVLPLLAQHAALARLGDAARTRAGRRRR